jgi:cytochrome c-type biogenesis protein CcmH
MTKPANIALTVFRGVAKAPARTFVIRAATTLLFAAAFSTCAVAQQTDAPAPVLNAQQAARGQALGKRMKCMCGGCDDAAGMCTHSGGSFAGPCDTAKAELKEVDARVARGESDDLISQDFVQEYGPTVLVEPPKRGFSWLAWIMPVAFPIIAVLLVWGVVQRWRERAALTLAGGPPIDPELLARAHRESGDSDE